MIAKHVAISALGTESLSSDEEFYMCVGVTMIEELGVHFWKTF
jgi:hypothetical protein